MSGGKLRGLVWRFGDNIDTDQIIPSRYCNTYRPEELAPHAMKGVDPDFAKRVAPGDIIVAGRNFGCGSSREVAPLALKAAGIGGIVAYSFARLFYRNAVNIGLVVLVSQPAGMGLESGEEVEIDPSAGVVHSLSNGRVYRCEKADGLVQEIIDAGGMVAYVREQLGKDASSG